MNTSLLKRIACLFLCFAAWLPIANAQNASYFYGYSNSATMVVGCRYIFAVDIQAIQDAYYQAHSSPGNYDEIGDIRFYWYHNSGSDISSIATVDPNSGRSAGTFGSTMGDAYIAINPYQTFSNNFGVLTQARVYYEAYSSYTGNLVETNTIILQLSAIAAPILGHVEAPNAQCANQPFTLSYKGSRGVSYVDWFQSSSPRAAANWQPVQATLPELDETRNFAIEVDGGIAATTYFKAVVNSCDGQVPPLAELEFMVTVPSTNSGGRAFGTREVGKGNNEGTVTLTDYYGQILKWQLSEDNGASWQDSYQTADSLVYSGLTRTTQFRAQVQQCGSALYSTACTITVNQDLNWVEHHSFDVDGGPVDIAATRTYFDSMGKTLQDQSINFTENVVLATQPLYGKYDQKVGSTLPAPIVTNSINFAYTPSFITPASAPTASYDYTQFDEPGTTRNAPQGVASSVANTLGWYYSANNTLEPYTATTSYPYIRTDAEADGSSGVSRSTLPGDVFRLGQGKENASGKFGILTELDTYLALRGKYFTDAEIGANATTLQATGAQQVTMDAHGQKTIAVVDKEGHTVMTMRPGESGATRTWLTVNSTVTIGWSYYLSIAGSVRDGGRIEASSDVMVYDQGGSFVYMGPARGFTWPDRANAYQFYCNAPFKVTTIDTQASTTIPAQNTQNNGFYNFYTLAAGPITITPILSASNATDYDLINTVSGELVSPSTLTNLPAGFYQVRIKKGKLTLTWSNSFQDISFNFYNQKGLLVGSVAPNGAKMLVDDYNAGNNAFTHANLPFFTSYEYDQQGRLLALNDPDAGRTEYIYRADGKLRFSQNAKQRNSDDNVFSYVGYDEIGRVIESGECVPNLYWYFRDNARTSAVLEAVGGSGLPSSYGYNDVVQSTYDVPVPLPSMAGTYTQSFLPGRVSATSKYSFWLGNGTKTLLCRTWFSYDDQGRTQWQVQQTANQPARTLEYTYNFNGNVLTACYQKNVPDERLTHYYEYNDDRKLTRVYTGQDNPDQPEYAKEFEQATYTYYLHGPLKRIVYGYNLQGVDYTYTAQGWLKGINDGDLARDPGRDGTANTYLPDLFGTTLNYYTNDYASRSVMSTNFTSSYPARYDGTVRGNMWQTPGSPLHAYGYYYDKKGQLVESMYGRLYSSPSRQYSFSPYFAASGAPFYEGDLTYDSNGNIGNITRTNETGAISLGVTYNYLSNTNKLAAVKTGNTPVISYDYDELGQMTGQREAAPGKTQYLDYNASGKVSAIYRDAARMQPVASYSYDEFGRRLQQRIYTSTGYTTTTFVRDGVGNELATYISSSVTGQTQLYEQPIYGATRLGTYRRQRDNEPAELLYELNDQLGNTRVVFRRPQTKSYLLSMESDKWMSEKDELNDVDEAGQYDNVLTKDYARQLSPHGPDYSMVLRPGKGTDTGPVRRLVVQRGDQVHMEAWAAYPDAYGGVRGRATLLIAGAAIAGANAAVGAVPTTDSKQTSAPAPIWKQVLSKLSLGVAIPLTSRSPGAKLFDVTAAPPKAALQYVLRRQSDNSFLRNGAAYISADAEGQWEALKLDVDITETEPCVLEISVQNYDNTYAIYFDDVKVDYNQGPVVQENHFYAYGQRILGGANDFMSWERQDHRKYRHGYQGLYSTSDEESGYDGFELRLYDSRIGRWTSTDPAGQYFSPYVGMGNNPVNMTDSDGGFSDYYDKDNNLVKHIDDGSNAEFRQSGSGINLHYEFIGYSNSYGSTGDFVLYGVVAAMQQKLNEKNPALQQRLDGTTFCNFATQNVINAVASASGDEGAVITGSASQMYNRFAKNCYWSEVNEAQAKSAAQWGSLAVMAHSDSPHGHVATFSTYDNFSKGTIANIGPKVYSGFVSLNMTIAPSKSRKYYIYSPTSQPIAPHIPFIVPQRSAPRYDSGWLFR